MVAQLKFVSIFYKVNSKHKQIEQNIPNIFKHSSCLKYTNSTMCNRLANLWVYQMYKETTAPCLAFKNMQTSITSAQNSFFLWFRMEI